jgi:nucleoside phosphorylase
MTLLKAFALLALASPLLVAQEASRATLGELVQQARARRDATDFRAGGRLVRITESGERKNYQISMRAHSFGDVVKVFCEVTAPSAARVRLLMESGAAGRTAVRAGHAGDAAPKELGPATWGDPLLDSDLTYEDLMENQFLWQKQTLVKQEKYGARDCAVVRSEPAVVDRSHYSAVTSWLDRLVHYPVKVEKVVKATGQVKEFIYYGLRESKGIWSASQIEVKTAAKSGSTLLIITRGAGKARLTAADFDPALLTKPY